MKRIITNITGGIQETLGYRSVLQVPEAEPVLLTFCVNKRERNKGYTVHDAHNSHARDDLQA